MTHEQAIAIAEKITEIIDKGNEWETEDVAAVIMTAFELLPQGIEATNKTISLVAQFALEDVDQMGLFGQLVKDLADGGITPKIKTGE